MMISAITEAPSSHRADRRTGSRCRRRRRLREPTELLRPRFLLDRRNRMIRPGDTTELWFKTRTPAKSSCRFMSLSRPSLTACARSPRNAGGDVMQYLDSPITAETPSPTQPPIRTGEDLAASDLFGLWADSADITDSTAFARQLRQQASHRQVRPDASGH
jgi:hypothetical protein